MDYKQFIGPTYNLDDKDASVQRTINMLPVPNEPGNERAGWVLKDAPGLDVFYPAEEDVGQIGSCIFVETFTGVAGDIASSSASFHDPDIFPTGFTYRTYGFTDAELDGNGYLVPPTAATAIGVEATLGGWTLSPTLPYYLQFKVLINGDTAGNGDLMAWTLADSGASAQIYLEVNYDLIPGQYAVSLQVDDGVATNSDNWQLTGVGVQDVILNVTSASVDVYANTVLMGTIYADMTAFTAYDSMQFAGNAFVNGNGDRSFMIDKAAMCEDATIEAATTPVEWIGDGVTAGKWLITGTTAQFINQPVTETDGAVRLNGIINANAKVYFEIDVSGSLSGTADNWMGLGYTVTDAGASAPFFNNYFVSRLCYRGLTETNRLLQTAEQAIAGITLAIGPAGAARTIGFAVDCANGYIWYSRGGLWYGTNSGTGDPATGSNPHQTAVPSSNMTFAIGAANPDPAGNLFGTSLLYLIKAGVDDLTYPVPSGFVPLNQAFTQT